MTDEQAYEWGRRALDAGYKWAPGALVRLGLTSHCGVRVGTLVRLSHLSRPKVWVVTIEQDWGHCASPVQQHCLGEPDYRDAATLGTLVAQAEERHGKTLGCIELKPDEFVIVYWPEGVSSEYCLDDIVGFVGGTTKIGAWVAALEAAPISNGGTP